MPILYINSHWAKSAYIIQTTLPEGCYVPTETKLLLDTYIKNVDKVREKIGDLYRAFYGPLPICQWRQSNIYKEGYYVAESGEASYLYFESIDEINEFTGLVQITLDLSTENICLQK